MLSNLEIIGLEKILWTAKLDRAVRPRIFKPNYLQIGQARSPKNSKFRHYQNLIKLSDLQSLSLTAH